jgi:hypothetical protein
MDLWRNSISAFFVEEVLRARVSWAFLCIQEAAPSIATVISPSDTITSTSEKPRS